MEHVRAIGALIPPDQVWPMFLEGATMIAGIFMLLWIAVRFDDGAPEPGDQGRMPK